MPDPSSRAFGTGDRWIGGICFLPAVVLFVALIDGLPYGYFTFLRLVVTIAAIVFAVTLFGRGKKLPAILAALMAILFNPILPIHLDRETWVILDVAAALVWVSLGVWALVAARRVQE